MDVAATIFRAAPNVSNCRSTTYDVKRWIIQEQYSIPSAPGAAGELLLLAHSRVDLVGSIRADAVATSLSAIESYGEARRGVRDNRALAWSLVKAYYSAFFCAHSLMRFFGRFSLWADRAHVSAIGAVAQAHLGTANGLPSKGAWLLKLDFGGGGVEVLPLSAVRGVHEVLWKEFSNFLDDLMNQTASSQAATEGQAQRAILALSAIKAGVDSGVLLRCRHDVNYRRGFGVWFPYVGLDPSVESSATRIRSRLDVFSPESIDIAGEDLAKFVGLVRAMCGLLVGVLGQAAKMEDQEDIISGPLRLAQQSRL